MVIVIAIFIIVDVSCNSHLSSLVHSYTSIFVHLYSSFTSPPPLDVNCIAL